jgi:hypothetical protein
MKTIEIEIEVMEYFGIRANLIVPNVSWGIAGLHECDLLILSGSNYATEVEIKVTKHDLLKDNGKLHGHLHGYIARLFFAVPEKLKAEALKFIPDRAGLLVVCSRVSDYDGKKYNVVELVRSARRNKDPHQWAVHERFQLLRLGAMRILGMKKKIMLLQQNK